MAGIVNPDREKAGKSRCNGSEDMFASITNKRKYIHKNNLCFIGFFLEII